jgi:hypothetical protein
MENLKISKRQFLSEEEEEQGKKKILARLQSDETLTRLIKENSLGEENVLASYPSIIRYLDDKDICLNCKGYRFCKKTNRKGLKRGIRYQGMTQSLEDYLFPCDYYKKVKEVFSHIIYTDFDYEKTYLVSSGVNEALRTYQKGTKLIEHSFIDVGLSSYKKCLEFAKDKPNQGAYIVSDNHNGDNLLLALAFNFAKKGYSVSLVKANPTLNNCTSNNPDLAKDAIKCLEQAKKADVMFIFGIGLEYKSPTTRDTTLVPLLLDRNTKGKATYFSSLLKQEDLAKAYNSRFSKEDYLYKVLAEVSKEDIIEDIDYFSDN